MFKRAINNSELIKKTSNCNEAISAAHQNHLDSINQLQITNQLQIMYVFPKPCIIIKPTSIPYKPGSIKAVKTATPQMSHTHFGQSCLLSHTSTHFVITLIIPVPVTYWFLQNNHLHKKLYTNLIRISLATETIAIRNTCELDSTHDKNGWMYFT